MRPPSVAVESPAQPTPVQSSTPSRDSTRVARNETQTPPPSYTEVQQKYQQAPSVSYQPNVYPQMPVNVGHYPHDYQQNYQIPGVNYGYPPQIPHSGLLYGPQQFPHPPPLQNFGQPQQFPAPTSVGYQRFRPAPNQAQQRPNVPPRMRGMRPPQQVQPTNKNSPKEPQNKPKKVQNNQKAKDNQQKIVINPVPKVVKKPVNPPMAPQKSGSEIILNLDDISNFKNPSKSQEFADFAKQLNKTKFKPLADARKSLVNNKYLSDVKFVINNEVIYGHKLFLATSSAKFYKHFHVDGNVEMKIEEIDRSTFVEVIAYCYTGQLKISDENVLSFLLAANVLEIRQITNMCSGFVNSKMNPETIFVIFEKAIEHRVEEFQKKCLDFITKNEEKCFQSKGFYDISLPSLMAILNALKFATEKSNQLIEKWTNGYAKTEEMKTPTKPTGAVKKPQKVKKIPSLMDLPAPPAEFKNFYAIQKPIRPFAASEENLINFDDDDDISGIICKDDSDGDLASEVSFGGHAERRTTFVVSGNSENYTTEFSRIDFLCMKSINVHEIWFNANLFASAESKSVRVTVMLAEEGKKVHVHTRFIKKEAKPGE